MRPTLVALTLCLGLLVLGLAAAPGLAQTAECPTRGGAEPYRCDEAPIGPAHSDVAYINDSPDLLGLATVQAAAGDLGLTVERLTIAEVLAGALASKPYRAIFFGRQPGPRLRGQGRLPHPAGLRIVEVGEAVLNDRVLFGDFLAPTDNALSDAERAPP